MSNEPATSDVERVSWRRASIDRTADTVTNAATSDDGPGLPSPRIAASFVVDSTLVWPNKPMVPTAPTQSAESPPTPLRRHIGRPLGFMRSQ